ncbi:MAG: putative 4-mercaptohistidine N1-methyltransferase [Chthoniobacterales bacterium]
MSAVPVPKGSEIYESPGAVSEYLLFHYGDAEATLGSLPGPRDAVGFATRLVHELIAGPDQLGRALDIGCAVGATAFELSKFCDSVVGVDFSSAFIDAASAMKNHGKATFPRRIEGRSYDTVTALIDGAARPDRVRFEVGDACALRDDIGMFDVVVAANLICRLPDPMAFLDRLPRLIHPGGQLLLTTPFTWMEEYTPVEKWLGAAAEGETSFEALKAILEMHFTLELTKDIPFLIREHSRKFQYSFALGSRWRRRMPRSSA